MRASIADRQVEPASSARGDGTVRFGYSGSVVWGMNIGPESSDAEFPVEFDPERTQATAFPFGDRCRPAVRV